MFIKKYIYVFIHVYIHLYEVDVRERHPRIAIVQKKRHTVLNK